MTLSGVPTLLDGEFNEVLSPLYRSSQRLDNRGMEKFKELIQTLQLVGIQARNGYFMWYRSGSSRKLDRVFVSPQFRENISGMELSLLKRNISDHKPLLISTEIQNWGPKPFRFLDCWLTHKSIIKGAWKEVGNKTDVQVKLRAVKTALK